MARLIFKNTGEEVDVEDGSSIAEACEQHGGIPFGCTNGVCGTCIAFVEGIENLSEPTEAEIDFLGQSGVTTERMMCQCKIMKGTVKISS